MKTREVTNESTNKVTIRLSGKGIIFRTGNPLSYDQETIDMINKYQCNEDAAFDGLITNLQTHPFITKLISVEVMYCDLLNCDENLEKYYTDSPIEIEFVDITEKKGKYINTAKYLSSKLQSPFLVMKLDDDGFIESYFVIELKEGEVFDPKKLQLIKSDYEVSFLPYGIIRTHICYDDKVIELQAGTDYYIEQTSPLYNFIYNDRIPYAPYYNSNKNEVV